MKFRGGILYYSLLVIVLTGVFIGFILLLSYYDNRIFLDKFNQDRIRRNVISAINIYLAERIYLNKRIQLQLTCLIILQIEFICQERNGAIIL